MMTCTVWMMETMKRVMEKFILRTGNFYEMRHLIEYSKILEIFSKEQFNSMMTSFNVLEKKSMHEKVRKLAEISSYVS
jgi:replicative DNA helicase